MNPEPTHSVPAVPSDGTHKPVPTIQEAYAIMARFNASHFNLPCGTHEHARYSIPADFKRDDDLLMMAFIRWAESLQSALEACRASKEREKDRGWIDSSKCLPPPFQTVWGYITDGELVPWEPYCDQVCYDNSVQKWRHSRGMNDEFVVVNHWHELPPSPAITREASPPARSSTGKEGA